MIRKYELTGRVGKIVLSIDDSVLTLERARREILNLPTWDATPEHGVYMKVAMGAAHEIARRVTTICRIEPQYAIVDMIPSGGWPEDTHKWLRIISNGVDRDALLFETDDSWIPLQARWFDVTMRLLKYFPRLSQRRDASQGPL